METFWGVISLLLVVAFIGAVGLLFYLVFGLGLAARKGSKHANLERQRLRVEFAAMSAEAIRAKLLNYGYFTAALRSTLQNFLSRVENLDEKSLTSEYGSEKQIYGMLHKAEREAGYRGRPECLDYFRGICDLLEELAKKA
jgi:hypothetical protein